MWRPMEPLLLFLLTFVAFSGAADEDVLQLGDDDFASVLKQHETTLVMFYAPWCGFCRRLEPEYAKAAEMVKGDDPPITLAKIDCTEAGKEICNKYLIKSYPTLKIFRQDDELKDYKGPRKATAIVEYMRVQVKPLMYKKSMRSIKHLAKVKRLAQILKNKDISIGHYDSKLVKEMLKNRLNEFFNH
ncbi:hypothetical protein KR038_006835 [Drosophila bunnanda]|nr:hypothetical protein KR038_006835 [Drosophila bunnanda]